MNPPAPRAHRAISRARRPRVRVAVHGMHPVADLGARLVVPVDDQPTAPHSASSGRSVMIKSSDSPSRRRAPARRRTPCVDGVVVTRDARVAQDAGVAATHRTRVGVTGGRRAQAHAAARSGGREGRSGLGPTRPPGRHRSSRDRHRRTGVAIWRDARCPGCKCGCSVADAGADELRRGGPVDRHPPVAAGELVEHLRVAGDRQPRSPRKLPGLFISNAFGDGEPATRGRGAGRPHRDGAS